jgi:hypothetical protein
MTKCSADLAKTNWYMNMNKRQIDPDLEEQLFKMVLEFQKKRGRHASFFDGPDKATKERGIICDFLEAISAKLNASVALAASGSLPENVNYAVKKLVGRSLPRRPDIGAAEHRSPTIPRIRAGSFRQAESAGHN